MEELLCVRVLWKIHSTRYFSIDQIESCEVRDSVFLRRKIHPCRGRRRFRMKKEKAKKGKEEEREKKKKKKNDREEGKVSEKEDDGEGE